MTQRVRYLMTPDILTLPEVTQDFADAVKKSGTRDKE
jgi:hypothetical protein